MKNLKKLLPVFAFVLGLGLVFTQSAFTTKTTSGEYGLYQGVWYDYNGTPPSGKKFICDGFTGNCTSLFTGDPNDPENMETPIPTNRVGEFLIVDED